jgi:hypothetical protein
LNPVGVEALEAAGTAPVMLIGVGNPAGVAVEPDEPTAVGLVRLIGV